MMATEIGTAFAVGHNLVGYLPESDVVYFGSWDEAKAYMLGELEYAADAVQSWADEHDCDDIPCPTYGDECPWQEANALSAAAEDLNLDNGPEWGDIVGNTSWWINVVPADEADLED